VQTLEEAAREVAAGDTRAFRTIVELVSDELVRLSARILGSLADAEDVVQEAFVKAHRELAAGRFDGRSSVKTWLYRIVTHGSIDALRTRSRRRVALDELEAHPWEGTASLESRVALRELSELLEGLPPEQRAALVLKAVEGLTTPEIASILSCSEGAVEQRLVRARAALRERRKE
jgi:RNA polymerase sigma-70 factor (ECF subfamily)